MTTKDENLHEFFKRMNRLDEAAEKAGGYVVVNSPTKKEDDEKMSGYIRLSKQKRMIARESNVPN
nr:hypothetical protein [Fredinandcohnia onubensis]